MALSKTEVQKIVNQFYDDIYKFCCARTRNPVDSQDITQEVFLIFADKSHKLTDENIRAWLYSVANNEIKKYFVKNKRTIEYVSIDECEGCEYANRLFSNGNLDDNIIFTETQKKIMSILNDEEKELFKKFYIEKLNSEEILSGTEITDNNLYVKKYRIKNKISKLIKNGQFVLCVLFFKFLF